MDQGQLLWALAHQGSFAGDRARSRQEMDRSRLRYASYFYRISNILAYYFPKPTRPKTPDESGSDFEAIQEKPVPFVYSRPHSRRGSVCEGYEHELSPIIEDSHAFDSTYTDLKFSNGHSVSVDEV
jgi:hypothetical protein